MKFKTGFILVFIILCSLQKIYAQCAMCKQAAESTLEHQPNSMARSLNTGIIYLMLIPYLLIAFIFRKQIWSFIQKYILKRTTLNGSDQ
jgi:hypothetical protein